MSLPVFLKTIKYFIVIIYIKSTFPPCLQSFPFGKKMPQKKSKLIIIKHKLVLYPFSKKQPALTNRVSIEKDTTMTRIPLPHLLNQTFLCFSFFFFEFYFICFVSILCKDMCSFYLIMYPPQPTRKSRRAVSTYIVIFYYVYFFCKKNQFRVVLVRLNLF